MGNIHIFIPDGLHERMRQVCRHKVTQQKFLEAGIEKLVGEAEANKSPTRMQTIFRQYAEVTGKPITDSDCVEVDLVNEPQEVPKEEGKAHPQYYVPEGDK